MVAELERGPPERSSSCLCVGLSCRSSYLFTSVLVMLMHSYPYILRLCAIVGAVLYWQQCSGIEITGGGFIDGQGYWWWWYVIFTGHDSRPHLIIM